MSETATTYQAHRSPRLTADERRDAIVAAGMGEFAARGLAGASVDAIARSAGVSQPYVYQLFGTKLELFLAVVRNAFERTRTTFEEAGRRYRAGDLACEGILGALALAYMDLLADRTLLLVQLQAYAACSEPAVQRLVRTEYGRLQRDVRHLTGASPDEIHRFFAEGMLLNVAAAVALEGAPTEWTLDQLGGAD